MALTDVLRIKVAWTSWREAGHRVYTLQNLKHCSNRDLTYKSEVSCSRESPCDQIDENLFSVKSAHIFRHLFTPLKSRQRCERLFTRLSHRRAKVLLTKTSGITGYHRLVFLKINLHVAFIICKLHTVFFTHVILWQSALYLIVLPFIVCSQRGQGSSDSDRSARKFEELLRKRLKEGSDF